MRDLRLAVGNQATEHHNYHAPNNRNAITLRSTTRRVASVFSGCFFQCLDGGLVGGVAATLLSAAFVWHFFIPPALSFDFKDLSAIYSAMVFIFMGGLFS